MQIPTIHRRCGPLLSVIMLLLAAMPVLSGCSGDDGAAGAAGAPGQDGAQGEQGAPGPVGPALGITVTDRHGKINAVQATKGPNNPANLCTTITNASVGTDGKLTVNFDVKSSGADLVPCTGDDMPYVGLPASVVNVVMAQLRLGAIPEDSSYWVSYINNSRTKSAGVGTTPDGTKMNQPAGETATAGTWTDNGNGSYRYVTSKVLTAGITIADPPKAGTYAYDANLTHRVAVQLGDHDGPTGPAKHGANNPIYDFIPATGQKVADPREIVVKENCNECHGTLSVHGSNGQRLDTKLCVTCHNATAGDPESGNNLDLKVMVHKIHMGKYLPSVQFDFAGFNAGLYNIDPEAAVKGTPYIIWGFNNTKYEWSEVGFPANVANCTKCHKDATHADNWKTQPTTEVCGACHDGINFATGTGTRLAFPDSKIDTTSSATGHIGGAQPTNSDCRVCHGASGTQTASDFIPAPVPALHDFVAKTKTDYTIDITMSAPGNGTHYVSGEAPVLTVVLKNKSDGSVIDHTALSTGTANLYVYGPRSDKKPVLTTAAASTTASTAGNSLLTTTTDPKVARTAASITYSLNSITGLQSGTYFVQVQATKPSPNTKTMSLALITFQIGTATAEKKVAVCTTCHENTMWHDTPTAAFGNHPAPFDPDYCAACHDYKAASNAKLGLLVDGSNTQWKGGGVCVNTAGTSATTDDTLDASKVAQAECLATANRKWMGSVCVTGGGLDPTITASAACTTAGGTWTSYTANNMGFGAGPIARRIHGVHFAEKADGTPGVNYPFEIYNGHNVSVIFPQDVKNCETCHTTETAGTWSSKSGRVACLACHDSDAARAHGTIMTVDPTPTADATGSLPGPFSGDEQESCAVCH